MIALQQIVILLALGWAAWTDWNEGLIDDRVSMIIILCSTTVMHALYGIAIGLGLLALVKHSRRMGEGDPFVLGSLSGVLSTEQFSEMCILITLLMLMTQGTSQRSRLGPYIMIATGAIFCMHLK